LQIHQDGIFAGPQVGHYVFSYRAVLKSIDVHVYYDFYGNVVFPITLRDIKAPVGIGREVLVQWNRDCSREMLDAPHLLVVGAKNSLGH
jgi:hypothetical protein